MSAAFWWLALLTGFLVLLVVPAIVVEWLLSRPDRRWLRQIHDLEAARHDWRARVIRDQCFWRE